MSSESSRVSAGTFLFFSDLTIYRNALLTYLCDSLPTSSPGRFSLAASWDEVDSLLYLRGLHQLAFFRAFSL